MSDFNFRDHLPLLSVTGGMERHKRTFPGYPITPRSYNGHGKKLASDITKLVGITKSKTVIDPSLIFKITYTNPLEEKKFDSVKLKLLSNTNPENNNDYIMFSDDFEMNVFLQKLSIYMGGLNGNKTAHLEPLFSNIESIVKLGPEDRKGNKISKITLDQNKHYWVNIELWHLGNEELMRNKITTYSEKIRDLGGRVTDSCLGDSFCILRANCDGSLVNVLLNEDNICEIDLIPESILGIRGLSRVSASDLKIGPSAAASAPNICIIDSGIMPNHPLLSSATKDALSFGVNLIDEIDSTGHGTLVASIALYGDVEKCINNKEFNPKFNLFSARVLNEHNEFPKEILIENQITNSIKYYYEKFNCKIFNLSLGIGENVYRGGKQFTLAQKIDELCRNYNIFVAISSGNSNNYPYDEKIGYEKTIKNYPLYLFEENSRIINPATAALAITVGSISTDAKVTIQPGQGAHIFPIANLNQPSPFARSGPGVSNSIKPEVCEYGGTCYYDKYQKIITSNIGTGVLGCNYNFNIDNILFTTDIGSSFATPKITHLAAQILHKYNGIAPNTIRALIAASCDPVKECIEQLEKIETEMTTYIFQQLTQTKFYSDYPLFKDLGLYRFKQLMDNTTNFPIKIKEYVNSIPDKSSYLKLTGYGIPNSMKALDSYENSVTMYAQDSINIDNFKIYEIFIPKELLELPSKVGKNKITISLAFSPPTRHTRKEYLGYDMNFKLIKNKSKDEITEIFKRRSNDDKYDLDTALKSAEFALFPKATILKRSTLKQASKIFTNRYIEKNNNILYLVVFNENKWVDDTYENEQFSIVVLIEHLSDEINIDIYEKIQTHINNRLKAIKLKEKVTNNHIKIK